MKYCDKKFYWTYQRGITWLNDYIGPDSMTWWIIEKSKGFADVGLLRISECESLLVCNTEFTSLCEIRYNREYCKFSDSSISLSE